MQYEYAQVFEVKIPLSSSQEVFDSMYEYMEELVDEHYQEARISSLVPDVLYTFTAGAPALYGEIANSFGTIVDIDVSEGHFKAFYSWELYTFIPKYLKIAYSWYICDENIDISASPYTLSEGVRPNRISIQLGELINA